MFNLANPLKPASPCESSKPESLPQGPAQEQPLPLLRTWFQTCTKSAVNNIPCPQSPWSHLFGQALYSLQYQLLPVNLLV
jgi:hypothetical protein